MDRRDFLKTALGTGTGLIILQQGALRTYAANEKVNVGLVGVSGRGNWFVGCMPKLSNVVAMCDVNDYRARAAYEEHPQARKFRDFRKMLDEMGDGLDAITVAVPDNTHAVITAAAMRAGKAVFCEKPLTHDVYEARQIRMLAREMKVATQMGNQGTASPAFRRGVDLLWAGALGDVCEVYAWNNAGGAGERPIPTETHQCPDTLDWDLWLGPAAYRPYNTRWAEWHTWRDFATGNLGNWASHILNIAFMGLRLNDLWADGVTGRTVKLETQVTAINTATFPKGEWIKYEFGARGSMPPVTINWCNGGGETLGWRKMIEDKLGRRMDWGDTGAKTWADWAGILLVGSKGMMLCNAHNTVMQLLPEKQWEGFQDPPATLPRSRGHENEWLDAIKGGPVAMSNFDYSGPLEEFLMLGNVATLFEGPLEFDTSQCKITNNENANLALKRQYREGWTL